MCVLHMSSSPSYMVKLGQFGACIFGNHQEPSLYGGMQPLEKIGPERLWRGCTLASPARHRLAPVGYWLGLDACHVSVLPSLDVWMGLC
jgi:hypothetical protein